MAYSLPLAVVLAGPNGAGKTTAAPRLLRGALAVNEFVDAYELLASGESVAPPTIVDQSGWSNLLERAR